MNLQLSGEFDAQGHKLFVKAETVESFNNLLKVLNILSSWKVAMHKVRYHSRRLVSNKGDFMTNP